MILQGKRVAIYAACGCGGLRITIERKPAERAKATPERAARTEIVEDDPYTVNRHGLGERTAGVQRVVDNPLDRLFRAGALLRRVYVAGCKYRGDAYLSGEGAAMPSVDWSRDGSKRPGYDRLPASLGSTALDVVEARLRHGKVKRLLSQQALAILDRALVEERSLEEVGSSVFGYAGPRDAGVAGKAGLVTAIGFLADVYDLIPLLRDRGD